jgi:rhamnose utilization protein RhaD (predicted bifunctional aldolase and dehydrogenase)
MILGQKGNHGSCVKCATSEECYETNISVVLTVKSGLGSSIY